MKLFIWLIVAILVPLQSFGATTLSNAGWHLVSPGSQTDLNTLLTDQPSIQSIWGWTGSTWSVHFRNAPSSIPTEWQTLSTLQANQAYWFNTTGSAVISGTSGAINCFSDYQLGNSTGWHLLGTPTEIGVIDFFGSQLRNGGTVWSWSGETWNIYTKGDTGESNQFNTTHGTTFSNLRTLAANQGYWVNMGEGNTVLSDEPCVVVQAGQNQVMLNWGEVSGVNNYALYYGASPNIDLTDSQSYQAKITTSTTSQAISGLTGDGPYYLVLVDESATTYEDIYQLPLQNSTGTLSYHSKITAGDSLSGGGTVDGLNRAGAATLSPDGKHLYVTAQDSTNNAVVVFEVNSSTGALTYVEAEKNNENNVANLVYPTKIVLSPNGQQVYVMSYGANSIVIFNRDSSTGALTYSDNVAGTTANGLAVVQDAVFSADGNYLYTVGHQFGVDAIQVSVFTRNATTGALTHLQTNTDANANANTNTVLFPVSIVLSPDEQFIYASGLQEGILAYSRNASNGELTAAHAYSQTQTGFENLATLRRIVFSPDGNQIYALSDNSILVLNRNSTSGALSVSEEHVHGTIASLENSKDLIVSSDGMSVYSTAYVGGFLDDDTINVFRRDLIDGKLTFQTTTLNDSATDYPLSSPVGVVVAGDGSHAYSVGVSYDNANYPSTLSTFDRTLSASTNAAVLSVPDAPTGLSASTFDGGVNLSWGASVGTFVYTVYQSTSASIDVSNSSTYQSKYENIGTNSYSVSSLNNGTKYYFAVAASNHKGSSSGSNEVNATPTANSIVSVCNNTTEVLPVSSDLFHVNLSTELNNETFSLSWTPVNNASKYQLEIPFGNSVYTVNTTSVKSFFTFDTSVASYEYVNSSEQTTFWKLNGNYASAPWSFTIHALDSSDNVFLSSGVHTATAGVSTNTLAQPVGLWGSSGNGSITLNWCDVPDADGYRIHYATDSSAIENNHLDVASGVKTATLTGLTNGTTYYLVVRAINGTKKGIPTYPIAFTPISSSSIDFSIDAVTLNQAVQADYTSAVDSSVPILAGKSTLMRIFARMTGVQQSSKVLVKLTGSRSGGVLDPIYQEMVLSDAHRVSTEEDHFAMAIDLPSTWLLPGTSFYLELDSDDQFTETDESNNRFPATGTRDLGFVETAALKVRLIPMNHATYPALTITDELKNGMGDYLKRLYPIQTLTLDNRTATLDFDEATTASALNKLEEYRALDTTASEKDIFYYGIINGNVGGLGNINPTATANSNLESVGSTDYATFAHEVAHNHGRYHVENKDETNDSSCQLPANADPNYPYNSTGAEYGRIGKMGYNTNSKELYSKTLYHDVMTYCDRSWISDYTYKALYDFETALAAQFPSGFNAVSSRQSAVASQEGFLIFGTVEGGVWTIDSIYASDQAFSSSGEYRFESVDQQGKQFSLFFGLTERDHSLTKRFKVFIPTKEPLTEVKVWQDDRLLLQETQEVTASDKTKRKGDRIRKIDENHWQIEPSYRGKRLIRISKDGGQTWRVLSMGKDESPITVEGVVGDQVEIQTQQGLSNEQEIYTLE